MIFAKKRSDLIDLFQRFIQVIEVNDGDQLVIAVHGPEGCGKSLVSDSFLHFLDDNRDTVNIPNEGKSVMEEDEGAALGRAHSEIISYNDLPIRFTIAREVRDVKSLPSFDGPDYVVFLHSWEKPPEELAQDITIALDDDYIGLTRVTTIGVSVQNLKFNASVSEFLNNIKDVSNDEHSVIKRSKSPLALKS
jgi:hypothetical protein